MDKSRKQFEDMAVKRGLSIDKKKDNCGQEKYKYDMIQIMWEGWQASRESLINNLEPVGYITSSGVDNIKEYGYTHLNEEKSEKINIPLYRLDK